MRTHGPIVCLLMLGTWASMAQAERFRITEVPSVTSVGQLESHDIVFAELRHEEAAKPVGLVPFEEWARASPLQKQFLSPFPAYTEPIVNATVDGLTKPLTEKLQMYVAEARFLISRPPQSIDLARYATLDFLERLDPAIEHRVISPTEVDNTSNKNPDRQWCEVAANVACVRSTYRLEGKLPMAVQLVNQLTDGHKLSDYLEFQSELRILAPSELDQSGLMQLTGLETPITGAIGQTIFHINQVMQFGKFLVVLQGNPADPNGTVVTAFIALALKARLLENSKKYENVPVLRNLVPGMVLAGKSSFNTGQSISAGLPLFARNNIKAVASILDETKPACPNGFLFQDCPLPIGLLETDTVPRRSVSELLSSDHVLGIDLRRRRQPERTLWSPLELLSVPIQFCNDVERNACGMTPSRRQQRAP
jgi:hypothetical protein